MTPLAPALFDRRFDDLLEIAHARLPGLAPAWTDWNLHDPGITLIELLAWVTEAQLYGLARMRRDERDAYAALFGVTARGPTPAAGIVWPPAAAASLLHSFVIAAGTPVHPEHTERPAYHTVHRQLWLAARLCAVRSIGADGRARDHSATNARGNVPWLPFGEQAGAHDRLVLGLAPLTPGGLAPRQADGAGALLIIGVRADAAADDAGAPLPAQPLLVELVDGARRRKLPVVHDTTGGLLRTGYIALDPAGMDGAASLALELRAPAGFARPPRITRLELNVIPVRQGALVQREPHVAGTLPDQALTLREAGLRHGDGAAVLVEVEEDGVLRRWERRPGLDGAGPHERVFVLDTERGVLRFGNGVNGAMPPAGAPILLSYAVCDGADGNAAPRQRWVVRGLADAYGTNPDPFHGGADSLGRDGQRREARRRLREARALVTAGDIEQAALALPALEVARARVLAASPGAMDGGITLVAMRARAGAEPDEVPESPRWLAEVQRRLSPRIPLGQRLRVRAPAYVPFTVSMEVRIAQGASAVALDAAIQAALHERLALTAPPGRSHRAEGSARAGRAFGAGVTRRDLAAWVRAVDGVAAIAALTIAGADGRPIDEVRVPPHGLPRLTAGGASVTIRRAGSGQ